MTLNSSGPISLGGPVVGQSIEIENGDVGTIQISLNDSAIRSLAGNLSGPISIANLYGKTQRFTINYTFTSSTPNATLNVTTLTKYRAGVSDITVTVNSGVYLYATSTSNYGLQLTGGTTGDTLNLINNGYIAGRGGDGGASYYHYGGNTYVWVGSVGGPALSIGYNTTLVNNSFIGGGGGGGMLMGGGGAGGGNGGRNNGSVCSNGGGPGASGGGGTTLSCVGTGGGGGRIFPGSGAGAGVIGIGAGQGGGGGGAGGAGGTYCSCFAPPNTYAGYGGSGGGAGGPPGNYNGYPGGGGGGGGWGASGGGGPAGVNSFYTPGSPGGNAIVKNGNTLTINVTGTIYGGQV